MIDVKLLAKGGLVILVIVALAILIEQLTWPGQTWDNEFDDSSNKVLPINDTSWPTSDPVDFIGYNQKFVKCLREHSENPAYYPITQRQNISISCVPSGRCLHNFLIHVTRVLESLNLRLILMEPSLLFCLMPSSWKYNLLTRGFTPTKYKGLNNVVTFGVESTNASILDEAKTRKRLASFRFKILRLARKTNGTLLNEFSSPEPVSQYFIIRYDIVMHLIILEPKETFLFSHAIDSSEMNVKGLQYVNDRAFENFTTSLTYLDIASTAPVLLPSDSKCFLLDMMSSQFLGCNGATSDMKLSRSAETLMALKELKSTLSSLMVIFWLWSKSLQGWYEKCDIQYYSKELRFSVAAKSVEGFNFSALFANSSCQHVESYSDVTNNISSIKLNCHHVSIHLIFMYEDKITYWTEYVDSENIYKLRFPKFTLCSTDIYGEKVNVPCETGEIFDSEYGQFLKNTTLNLNPGSMENVMLLAKRK